MVSGGREITRVCCFFPPFPTGTTSSAEEDQECDHKVSPQDKEYGWN